MPLMFSQLLVLRVATLSWEWGQGSKVWWASTDRKPLGHSCVEGNNSKS